MTRVLLKAVRERADVLAWIPPDPVRAIASGPLGGGLGERSWVLNVTVESTYAALDPDRHLAAVASELGLAGAGVGMMTAVDVGDARWAGDVGAEALVTVGLGWPTWAAAPDGAPNPYGPGTINVIAWVPVALADEALVGAVVTVTEAKTQALSEAGVPGTGTASDAVCVGCPVAGSGGENFAGPRSPWGARLARAVHRAVTAGITTDAERARATGHPR